MTTTTQNMFYLQVCLSCGATSILNAFTDFVKYVNPHDASGQDMSVADRCTQEEGAM